MHLRNHLLSRPSTSNHLDNIAHPMVDTNQAPDLEGLHCEMHVVAEQIRVMNEINVRLVQHLVINNLPLATAPVLEEADRSHLSHRSGDQDS